MGILLALLIPFIVSVLCTFSIKQLAIRRNLLDRPGAIRIHTVPKPRLGGLGMALGWLAGMVLLFFIGELDTQFFTFLTGASCGFLLFGAVDDLWALKPGPKILALSVLTLAAVWFLPTVGWSATPLGKVFSFIWILGVINAVNMVDGMDGLAGENALICALFLSLGFLLTDRSALSVAMLPLIASILGFLIWNFPPAKIFMGDSGSTFLGFQLSFFVLYGSGPLLTINSLGWGLLLGIFLIELWLTAYRRLRKKQVLSKGDLQHSYNVMADQGWSGKRILFVYAVLGLSCCIAGLLVALLAIVWLQGVLLFACLAMALLLTMQWRLVRGS